MKQPVMISLTIVHSTNHRTFTFSEMPFQTTEASTGFMGHVPSFPHIRSSKFCTADHAYRADRTGMMSEIYHFLGTRALGMTLDVLYQYVNMPDLFSSSKINR
jgi:hypothetical protein